ncbi:hypothetical protein J7E98_27205 [Streptomyces sp. ISL-86]|nr:hypothetical protein [Streptomyces sp. ISL-86]
MIAGFAPVLVHNTQPCTFANQMPDNLERELRSAENLGVTPSASGTAAFDRAIDGEFVKWVILEDGSLVVVAKNVQGQEIYHSVLSNGDPVLAAGEANIVGSNGTYFGIELNNHSGHFRPSSESLELGRQAFARAGVIFH